jgi:endonuclease/exonuclease/phosphatase family metal-dependent hydrolase
MIDLPYSWEQAGLGKSWQLYIHHIFKLNSDNMKVEPIKLATWNLEWARPKSRRAELIQAAISAEEPEVVCYTEVNRDFVPEGHLIEANSDYGYSHNGTRRKVILWSKTPWSDVDIVGDPELPSGRFASGISGGVRFVGVCIPWRDAHVISGRKDMSRWEDHLLYCEGLGRVLARYAESNVPVCVLGDYNQRIPRFRQPKKVAEALAVAFPQGFRVVTEGMTDIDGHGLIDHFAVSSELNTSTPTIIPRVAEDGTRLSDHVGVAATLDRS